MENDEQEAMLNMGIFFSEGAIKHLAFELLALSVTWASNEMLPTSTMSNYLRNI